MERNYSNKFNPFIPPNYPYIDSRFSSYAFKCLKTRSLTIPEFVSPNTEVRTGICAQFYCFKKRHSEIDIECTCGFYSFKLMEDAWDYSIFSPLTLIFKTRLLGSVIEHNIGYRSEAQEITALILTSCAKKNCNGTPEFLNRYKSYLALSCLKHKKVDALEVERVRESGIGLIRPN